MTQPGPAQPESAASVPALPAPLASLARAVWWIVLLRGILAIIFGILAVISPAAALTGITIVFGAYAVVDGVMAISHGISVIRAKHAGGGWLIFQGAIAIIAGLAALFLPLAAGFFGGLFVIWTIAFYAIVNGIAGIGSATSLSHGTPRKGVAIASAILTLVFGVVLALLAITSPASTVVSLIWIAGIYAIVFGVIFVFLAIQVRRGAQKAFSPS